MENGWSRFHSSFVNGVIRRTIWRGTDFGSWLSQANYVFSELLTPPKHGDCLLIESIEYQLSFSSPSENLPEGYLFLCPLEDFRDHDGRWISNPECPAYWSLDPSGQQRLSAAEASRIGFSSLTLERILWGRSWTENVYAALSHFHAGKGFDPSSQDVVRHLGHPLYVLFSSADVDSARGEYQSHIIVCLTWLNSRRSIF
ncbi:hypothetical protein C8R44DRAFT_722870 [Mycena epipterygia]|nr:hypothetical protein C8R44DRAFT_722870 [Mycena epipterygia]